MRRLLSFSLLLPHLLLGCGDDDAVTPEDMGAEIDLVTTPRDMGQPRETETFAYTPTGCERPVSTPEVIEPGMSGETLGEDPEPIHVHVAIGEEASSAFAVTWRTDVDTDVTQLLLGLDEDAVAGAEGATDGVELREGHTFTYETNGDTLLDNIEVRIHEVHVCALDQGTTYYYKVGGPGHWSDVYDVATAPTVGSTAPWSFAASGDSRNNNEGVWQLAQRQILDSGADLHVFSGDAVDVSAVQGQWDALFEATDGDFSVQEALARIPFMVSNGNHDMLRVNYLAQFSMPQDVSDGELGQGEEWYSFDYANAHFVVLNDTVDDDAVIAGAEADWLRADLEAVDREVTPWVFVVHHRNLYTCMSTHGASGSLRAAWQPLYDEFEVDAVFQGHNHVYERSKPIRGTAAGDGVVADHDADGVPSIAAPGAGSGSPSGTIYFTAAAIGAPLYPVSDTCATTQVADSVANYLMVEIEDRTVTVTARSIMDGAVIDTVSYTK